ncbi:MAG: thioesterase family protein [Bacteroidota bacterium]|nr:thioesterase family protein [Bacteroidota bacterium]
MGRIKINLPEHFTFQTFIPIRISDINYGGHLGNDSILSLVHEARIQFLNQYGCKELDVYGVGLIMSDAAIEFKQEAFYNDILKIEVAIQDFSRVGFDLYYKLSKQRESKEAMIAIVKTGMICYDYEQKKVVSVPEKFKEHFAS